MSTAISLTIEQIKNRVNTSNKFTKAEISLHRKQITKLRKEKRVQQNSMSTNEVDALVAVDRQSGFTMLQKRQESTLKSGVKEIHYVFRKPVVTAEMQLKKLEEEAAELRAQVAELLKSQNKELQNRIVVPAIEA